MINYIWSGMIILSFICSVIFGNTSALSESIISSGSNAVTLCFKLLGMLCLWGGLMNIAEKSGLTKLISRLLSPVLCRLMPSLKTNSSALSAVSMNVTANLFGLGNAATPLGLEAMRRMQGNNLLPEYATDDMVVFVVLNSAALRIIPTTVAMLRSEYGATQPMDIMPPTWLSSACALTVGITLSLILRKYTEPGRKRKEGKESRKR
ncbi:MAG: spore maturation protein A [Clostridiales bacterium]|nr:spore maturation protein A [Clostridiales bacterium]